MDDRERSMLATFARIAKTEDGKDMISYLQNLSSNNYKAFKGDEVTRNEYHKGYAVCCDEIIDLLTGAETLLRKADMAALRRTEARHSPYL